MGKTLVFLACLAVLLGLLLSRRRKGQGRLLTGLALALPLLFSLLAILVLRL